MRIQYKQLKPIEVVCVAESFSGHSNYDLKPVEVVFCELWPNLAQTLFVSVGLHPELFQLIKVYIN
jgi:hypothetical protein